VKLTAIFRHNALTYKAIVVIRLHLAVPPKMCKCWFFYHWTTFSWNQCSYALAT